MTDLTIEGDFERDGAVCVRGLFDAAEMANAAAAVEANMQQPGELAKVASADDGAGFWDDFCSWQRIPLLHEFVSNAKAAEVAGLLMGSRQVRLYHDHVLVKEPGTAVRTPWHQDQPYYNVAGSQNASMWCPVDAVPRSYTLEFWAGSHRGPWYMPRSFRDAQAKWFPDGSLEELPDIDGNPDRYPVVGWELQPGDAVFFHMLTVHSSNGLPAGSDRRRVISVRYLGDDMVHAVRPWRTSPPFTGLAERLPDGAPMHDETLFPILWERAS
ncbi:MAG: phytanoyl-CoA dioxygenase family protein [Ilumatobacteraceae bacterium]